MKIDRKCPFYRDSQKAAWYCDDKEWYIESQIVNVDCILYMEQVADMEPANIQDFARTVFEEYGAQRPLHLLSDYVVQNTRDKDLLRTALQFQRADDNLQVRIRADQEKVYALFQGILQEGQEELSQYRLFDATDCEPLQGEKSLGRIMVMRVDDIPYELRTQDSQLAWITPELLKRPLHKVTFIDGGEYSSCQDLSDRIIGVLKEELVPPHVRDILAGKSVNPNPKAERPPLEIDKTAPLYRGDTPFYGDADTEQYMASTAANIAFIMSMEDIPDNKPDQIWRFAEQLTEEYGDERPQYLLKMYFLPQSEDVDLVRPNLGYYFDGRVMALYYTLKNMSSEIDRQQQEGTGMTLS